MKMLSDKRAIDKIFRRRDRYDIPGLATGARMESREKATVDRLDLACVEAAQLNDGFASG